MTEKQATTNSPIEIQSLESFQENRFRSIVRKAFVALEIAVIVGIGVWWLASRSVRESKSLWVLFIYSFPSEFIVAALPHEPVLLYFGKYHSPLAVALVAIAGTLLTEAMNYHVFRFIADLKLLKKLLTSKLVQKLIALFNKAPFAAIWIAAFTPIPFYPFRFLVVLSRYPIYLYLLAVLTARTPRFYLLAAAANILKLSNWVLVAVFAVVLSWLYGPPAFEFARRRLLRTKASRPNDPS